MWGKRIYVQWAECDIFSVHVNELYARSSRSLPAPSWSRCVSWLHQQVAVCYFFLCEKIRQSQVSKFRILKVVTKTRNVSTHETNCRFCKSKSRKVCCPESCVFCGLPTLLDNTISLLELVKTYYLCTYFHQQVATARYFCVREKYRQITTRQSPSSK